MNKQRIAILIIASLGAVATFMPWSSLPILGSMNGINTKIGKFSLILFLVPLVVSLLGNKTKELKGWLLYMTIIPTVIAVLADLLQLFGLSNRGTQSENAFENLIAEQMRIGFGLYIAILSGIMLLIFTFLMKSTKQSDENKLNNNTNKRTSRSNHDKLKIIDKEKKKSNYLPKTENRTNQNETISKLKKESSLKKDFKPSDHSKFMPK
ncbi:hypothetical protein ABW636_06550 [Aquimarina sp. 2201CG1-2-11]|uniref:hypothetical protein n=1 Tax=Aquimarina discodermiae TaxID=3231043 RepID=UPI0034618E68